MPRPRSASQLPSVGSRSAGRRPGPLPTSQACPASARTTRSGPWSVNGNFALSSWGAACDRVILAQAEYRGHLSLHWSYGSAAPQDESAKFPFTLQGPDLVVLADAGQAWLVGSGPGRLPADRLPTLGSWLADLGLGIDWGGLGLYVAKAVTAGEPLRFTLRLDHRF